MHRQLQNGFIISLHDRRRNAQGSKQEFISTCLSIYLSIYLSVCLSVCLSIFGCSITSHTVQRREKKTVECFHESFSLPNYRFPSLPFFSPPFLYFSLCRKVATYIQFGSLGKRCKLPQRGPGQSQAANAYPVYLETRKRVWWLQNVVLFLLNKIWKLQQMCFLDFR